MNVDIDVQYECRCVIGETKDLHDCLAGAFVSSTAVWLHLVCFSDDFVVSFERIFGDVLNLYDQGTYPNVTLESNILKK